MAVELEGLEFQIEAKSGNASKGIEALANSFTKLKNSLNGKGLEKISQTLDSINKSLNNSGIGKLEGLTNALNTLNSVKISSTIPKHLVGISAALESITSESIDRVERLSAALQGMNGVNIPNLKGLKNANPALKDTDTSGAGAQNAPSKIAEATDEIVRATSATQVLKNVLNSVGGVFSKTFSMFGSGALKTLKMSLTGLLAPLKAVVSQGAELGKIFGSKLAAKVKNTTSSFGKLFASIKRIAMYRLIRFMFAQLTKAIKEGANNLYQYSLLMGGTFSKSMDSCATSFLYLKNSMGAMIGPLINSIAPALDFIIGKVVNLFNLINQLFARLSGASVYTAAKKVATSYGESAEDAAKKTKKAAKEIKDATGSIDELNIISQKDNSGSGKELPDYGSMFEELPISDTISEFADKLKQAIELEDWEGLGKLLGNKFNEIIDGINWAGIGRKIGNCLDSAVKTAYHFLKTADFSALGKHLAQLINNALLEIDGEYIGRLFVRFFTAALDFLIGALDGLNWSLVGRTVGNAIQGAISEAYEWIKGIDFSRFGGYFAEGINNALKAIDANILGKTAVLVITGIWDILIATVRNLDWGLIGKTIGDFLKGGFDQVSDWFKKMDWSQLAHDLYNQLKEFVAGLDFAGISQSFFRYFGSALGAAVSFIGTFIADVVTDIKNYFLKYIRDENGDGKFGGVEIIKGLLLGIWDGIKNIGTWIKENVFDPFIQGFKDCFGIHSPSTVMREMGKYIVEGLLLGLTDTWRTITDFFTKVLGELVDFFKGKWEDIKTATSEKWEAVKSTLETIWTNIRERASATFTNIKDTISQVWDAARSKTSEVWNSAKSLLEGVWSGIKTVAGTTFSNIKTSIVQAWENVKSTTSNTWNSIKSTLSSAWDGLKTTAGSKFDEIKESIGSAWENVKTATSNAWGDIKSAVSQNLSPMANDIFSTFKEITSSASRWGSDICDNLASGIRSGIHWVTDAVRSVADRVSSYIHFSEPDVGPLSNFHTYMPDMLKLMASGILDNAYLAENAVYELTSSISKTLNKSREGFEIPVSTRSNVQYIADYGERFSQDIPQSEGFVTGMRDANSEVVSTLYAIAGQLVTAIEAVADRPVEVELDSRQLLSRIEKTQRERGKMIMMGGVVN